MQIVPASPCTLKRSGGSREKELRLIFSDCKQISWKDQNQTNQTNKYFLCSNRSVHLFSSVLLKNYKKKTLSLVQTAVRPDLFLFETDCPRCYLQVISSDLPTDYWFYRLSTDPHHVILRIALLAAAWVALSCSDARPSFDSTLWNLISVSIASGLRR